MSILIQLDQKESQELFKPGGKVKIVTSKEIIYGFLFRPPTPSETDFWILNPSTGEIKKIEYFRCQQIWYTCTGLETGKFKKAVTELQNGSRKLKKTLTTADAEYIKNLLTEIESFSSGHE